ncbi:MAG: ABC transporter ATP-binding protein [Candidatus Bathyarchaeia archaeon]
MLLGESMIIRAKIEKGTLNIEGGSYLEVERLSFSYPKRVMGLSVLGKRVIQALRNVNLKIDEGDIVLITGSNGSGKTTLISALSGLIEPEGSIFLGGVKATPKVLREKCSAIFSEYLPFYGKLKVRDIVRLFSSIGYDLETLPYTDRYLHTLSHGELARLSYNIWLGKPSEVYLGDEVGMELDDINLEILYNSVKKKSDEGKIIILTSPFETNLFKKFG